MAFSHLLIPLDLSESSLHALRLALRIARPSKDAAHKARLTLLYVGVSPAVGTLDVGMYGVMVPDTLLALHEQLAKEHRAVVERIAQTEIPEDVEFRVVLREGYPPDEILAEATESGCDLIVMGTHGRTGLERVLVGSVTERVLRTASIPVLVTH